MNENPAFPDEQQSFDFDDITPQERPVNIGGRRYLVREASEGVATRYRNAVMRAGKMADGVVVGIEGLADAEPLLVSLCMFEVMTGNGDGQEPYRPVLLKTVRDWPARVVKPIFEWIKLVSALDEAETKEVLFKRIAEAKKKLKKLDVEVDGQSESPVVLEDSAIDRLDAEDQRAKN